MRPVGGGIKTVADLTALFALSTTASPVYVASVGALFYWDSTYSTWAEIEKTFGRGQNGDLVIAGGTTTLAAPAYYRNLTVTGGVLQGAEGCHTVIYVAHLLTLSNPGIIRSNISYLTIADIVGGVSVAGPSAGNPGGAMVPMQSEIMAGGAGGGGCGGGDGANVGGNGGMAYGSQRSRSPSTNPRQSIGNVGPGLSAGYSAEAQTDNDYNARNCPIAFGCAGSGGGSGAANALANSGAGGGGGNGRGSLIIRAARITGNGALTTSATAGGNGGSVGAGVAGGGGGGGGGGAGNLIQIYGEDAFTGTRLATGGAAGLKGNGLGGGSDGRQGGAGGDGLIVIETWS
jgi:hypothetical protein